jgi:mercuric ion binding protein
VRKLFTGIIVFSALFTMNAFAQCAGCAQKVTCDKAEVGMDEITTAGNMAVIELPTVKCEMCKTTIEAGLLKLDGIKSVDVNIEKKIAHIKYDAAKLNTGKIEQVISKLGYQANKLKADKEAYTKLADCCKEHES